MSCEPLLEDSGTVHVKDECFDDDYTATICPLLPTSSVATPDPDCTNVHPNMTDGQLSPPLTIKAEPISPQFVKLEPQSSNCTHFTPYTARKSIGRFSVTRTKPKEPIDIANYQFGLYSYYAEDNTAQVDQAHLDPYYTQQDLKDPELLARAKRYFQNLRNEVPEISDEFALRKENGPGHGHHPMYERKRRKKEAVLLIPKLELDPMLRIILLEKYAPVSVKNNRWKIKKHCRQQDAKSVAASKLRKQAILNKVRHHNDQEQKLEEFLAQLTGKHDHKPCPYSHENQRTRQRVSRPAHSCCNKSPQSRIHSSDEASSSSSPASEQLSDPLFEKSFQIDIKDEQDAYCQHTIKQESSNYGESGSSEASLSLNISIKQEKYDPVPVVIKKSHKSVKRKKVLPLPTIKQESIEMNTSENIDSTACGSLLPDTTPTLDCSTEVQTELPPIKEEYVDEEMMVEIKKNRVKKLRPITVDPIISDDLRVSIKEEPVEPDEPAEPDDPAEPVDSEDIFSNIDIKEEPVELNLLQFVPAPKPKGKNIWHRKPKFVYGKRINRNTVNPNLNQDFEFDSAANLSAPFSPPKSSWQISKGEEQTMTDDEKELEAPEEREMRQKVDQLMQEGTIDDADELYRLFSKTLKQCQDPTENVFNTVLDLFKSRKEMKVVDVCPEKKGQKEADNTEEDNHTKSLLFPMSDHEIYNQEVTVVADYSTPAEEFIPTIIKTEEVEAPSLEFTSISHTQSSDSPLTNRGNVIDDYSENFEQFVPGISVGYNDMADISECHQRNALKALSAVHRNRDWRKIDGEDIYHTSSDKVFHPLGKEIKREPGYEKSFIYPPKKDVYPAKSMKEKRPSQPLYTNTNKDVTEAERLFDELIEEEQVPFVPQDPNQTSFIEPFRPDSMFSNHQSLDDLIKAPLVPNEHLIKPKPSYAPMTFDNSENKPPVVLFSSKQSDETCQKENQDGWGRWKGPNETFDHFQHTSEWEDHPSWSPGHSDWVEPYFTTPTTAQQSGFDEHRKDTESPLLDKSCGSDDDMAIRHPVTQRHVQTQFPYDNIYSEIEYSWPHTVYIKERQIYINHSFTQTPGPPLFPLSLAPGRFRRRRPVLVEPLPTIEPIGDTVTQLRTMRTSDSYSLLMERLRTCTDPSFDRFMNSQRPPTGLVSTFNQFACYSPQANIPELPLTVNKSYSDKSNSVGKRPGIVYKEVTPKPYNSHHSTAGLTPYQISVKIRKMGQVENIIGRLQRKKRNSANCKPKVKPR